VRQRICLRQRHRGGNGRRAGLKRSQQSANKPLPTQEIDLIGPLPVQLPKEERPKGRSRASLNIEIRHLHAMFGVAVDWKLLKDNPLERVKQPKIPDVGVANLSPEDFKRFWGVLPMKSCRDMVALAVFAAHKQTELINLTWKEGYHRSPVPRPTRQDRTSAPTSTLCTTTFATWMPEDGAMVREVQRITGHPSITATRRYSHLVSNGMHEAVGKLPRIDLWDALATNRPPPPEDRRSPGTWYVEYPPRSPIASWTLQASV